MGVRGLAFAVIFGFALTGRAEDAAIPSWLPEDFRFAVQGTSNEVAEAERTLTLMRDRIHPKLWQMMDITGRRNEDASREASFRVSATNTPALLGSVLEWVTHVSLAGVTNEASYLDSYKKPLLASDLNRDVLTNRVARLSALPSTVKLSLVFDDGTRKSVLRAIPGVDYPGVAYEDEGSTERSVRISLCAPKLSRRFMIRAEAQAPASVACEMKWMKGSDAIGFPYWERKRLSSHLEMQGITVNSKAVARERFAEVLVFARTAGGLWGVPSRVIIVPDTFGHRTYTPNYLVESIDYGDFRDVYRYGENDVMLGFTRIPQGMVRGEAYSNLGELIVSSYSDDHPKSTQKVLYFVKDGRLLFKKCAEIVKHKNEMVIDRSRRW